MTTDELDRLEALAALAADSDALDPDDWYDAHRERGYHIAGTDLAFIAACDPDTIRRLVQAVRESGALGAEYLECQRRLIAFGDSVGAKAAREPLDVERLAIALCANRPPTPAADIDMFVDDECRTLARAIAAEYVALRKPVPA